MAKMVKCIICGLRYIASTKTGCPSCLKNMNKPMNQG